MAVTLPRIFHLLPALLTTLLLAATPAIADPLPQVDAVISEHDGSAQPQKLADHSQRRSRAATSLEEFFESDDDAEQHVKLPPTLVRECVRHTLVSGPLPPSYRAALAAHRACAAPPTGPPHA